MLTKDKLLWMSNTIAWACGITDVLAYSNGTDSGVKGTLSLCSDKLSEVNELLASKLLGDMRVKEEA